MTAQNASEAGLPAVTSDQFEPRIRSELAAMLGVPDQSVDAETPLGNQGIDSLYLIELLLRLESAVGVRLEPESIPRHVTLSQLVAMVTGAAQARTALRPVPVIDLGAHIPLTPSQMEFLSDCETGHHGYALVLTLRTPPDLDVEALVAALHALERHDALRLRFRQVDGQWIQEYGQPGSSVGFRQLDASGADEQRLRAMGEKFFADIAGNFNLEQGPLAQAVLFHRGSGQSGLLFLCVQHLAVDGASVPLLLAELENRYQNRSVAEPDVSYGDWARRLEDLAQTAAVANDLPYWERMCQAETPRSVPADVAIGTTPAVCLSPEASRAFLDRYPTSQGQHDALLAAFGEAWAETSGQHRFGVRVETHGRFPLNGSEPIRTVGWFSTHFPLLIDTEKERIDHSLVRRLIDGAPTFGLSFGLLKYLCRNAEIRQAMHRLRLPALALAYRGRWDDYFRPDCGLPMIARFVLNETRPKPASLPALTLHAGVAKGGLRFHFSFMSGAFPPAQIENLAARIQAAVAIA